MILRYHTFFFKSYRELYNNSSVVSPIIASYAFGSASNLDDNYMIGMSADKINEDNIVITFMGGIQVVYDSSV